MAWNGKQYALTATATNLTTILGLGEAKFIKELDIFNNDTATAAAFLGKSNVTNVPANAFAKLPAGVGYSIVPGGHGWNGNTDEIFVVGTVGATNIAFIAVID